MRRPVIALLVALLLTAANSSRAAAPAPDILGTRFAMQFRLGTLQRAVLGGGKIQHVIVIVQENRTIDNLFQGFAGADTVSYGMSGKQKKKLIAFPLQYALDPDHGHTGFVTDYDGGALDGFDHGYVKQNCYHARPQCTAYAFVRHLDSAIYFALAKQYALADHVVQMNEGPSFANHVYMIAAQGGYPIAIAGNETEGAHGPGCMSPTDSRVQGIDLRQPFPYGLLTNPIPACRDLRTVLGLLDGQGLSWRYYTPTLTQLQQVTLNFWTPPIYIKYLYNHDLPHVVTTEVKILSDIRNKALRAVSYTAPTVVESDHPHQPAMNEDPQAGPHWVNSIVSAVAASPVYRNNTTILVTWDDWGGWYDHYVPPPQFKYGLSANSYGFRTPLLVISPYVIKRVDHTARSQASIIRFIESVFGLPSLGVLDAQTDDLSTMFDFSQPPHVYQEIGGSVATQRFRGADVYPLHADPDE